MNSVVLRAIGTANPRRYATQQEFYDWLVAHFPLTPLEAELYSRTLFSGAIKGRYFGVDSDEKAADLSADNLLQRFRKHGTASSVQASRDAMHAVGLLPSDIGGLVINTSTGYLCPGLTSYVAEQLGLDTGVITLDLVGMGCGAAIANLQTAAGLLASSPGKPILSVAVEINSATFFMGPDADLVISNSIFGDGAAAVIVDTADKPGRVRILDFEMGLYPEHREDLRYHSEDGRLRKVQSGRTPQIAAKMARETTQRLLGRHGLIPEQVDWWAAHPGGTDVLEQVGQEVGLPNEKLRFSYEVLHEYGNMSSPSVLFVLKRLLCKGKPKPGQKGILLTFGAGFSVYTALVEF